MYNNSDSRNKHHKYFCHLEARPFECWKGCGMKFKQKGWRRNHEKVCDGSGRRPGPKTWKRGRNENVNYVKKSLYLEGM